MFTRLTVGDDVVVSNRRNRRTVGAGPLKSSTLFTFTVERPNGPTTYSRFTHRVSGQTSFLRGRLRRLRQRGRFGLR